MVISQKEIATDQLGKSDNMTKINYVSKDKGLIKKKILLKNNSNNQSSIQKHYHYCSGCGKSLYLNEASIIEKIKSIFANKNVYVISIKDR